MELRQLKYFVAVAEHLNFTKASKELYVNQSAVSQQIASLEEHIGVKLFKRDKRNVQLTNAGKALLEDAKKIIAKTESAIENAQKAEKGITGKLKIGFLIAPVREFLPVVIRNFKMKYPDIEIQLYHLPTASLNNPIKSTNLDIVFTSKMGLHDFSNIEYKTLFSERVCAFLHKNHPLLINSSISLKDLENENFVMRHWEESPQWFEYVMSICSQAGFKPNIVNQTKRIETVLVFVESGLGITILPKYLKMYASPNIHIAELEEEYNIEICYYINKNNDNPSLKYFINELDLTLNNLNNFIPKNRVSTPI